MERAREKIAIYLNLIPARVIKPADRDKALAEAAAKDVGTEPEGVWVAEEEAKAAVAARDAAIAELQISSHR